MRALCIAAAIGIAALSGCSEPASAQATSLSSFTASGLSTRLTRAAAAAVASGPILDSLPAPAAAWSYNERLKTTYTGSLFRVRDTTSTTQTDIGYGGDNKIDRAALATACATTHAGTVVTTYDQSGNTRNLTEATTASQPSIYASSAPRAIGGNVVALFDGNDDDQARADSMGITGDSSLTIFVLYKIEAAPAQKAFFSFGTSFGNEFVLGLDATSLIATCDESVDKWPMTSGTSYHYDIIRHTSGQNMSLVSWRQNGATLTASATVNSTVNITSTSTRLGAHVSNVANADISVSTLIVWASALSAGDVTTLETWAENRRLN